MHYIVPPGLYAIGMPTADAPVIVTANYKMTYDIVRRALAECDVWLLILETYGINVWCAAGKGTFGTNELVERVRSSELSKIVSHRHLILPILGAPGIAAHQVATHTGFNISYAAIDAADLPTYLDNGKQTTSEMRTLSFPLYQRLVLIPVELVLELKTLATIAGLVLIACTLAGNLALFRETFTGYAGAAFSGIVLAPLLLPWLPGKRFAVKGAALGVVWTLAYYGLTGHNWTPLAMLAAFLVLPAVCAYHTLSFTGCTPYTSPSGVREELRTSIPLIGCALLAGVLLLTLSRFF